MIISRRDNIYFLVAGALCVAAVTAAVATDQFAFLLVPFIAISFLAGWLQPSLLFYTLIASLPFSFEFNFNPTLGTDIPDELLMLIVSLVFFCYWLYKPMLVSGNVWRHPLVFFLLLHIAWVMVATLASGHLLLSVKMLLAKMWYIGAFVLAAVIVLSGKERIRTAAIVFAVSMMAATIVSIWRHAGYDFTFANINDAVYPFFRNHVNYSSMLVCVIPVLIAFARKASRRHRNWIVLAIAIMLFALFLSYARGAWLALALGLLSYWLIRNKLLVITYVLAIVVTVSALFWVKSNDRYLQYAHDYRTTIFHENLQEHLVATYQLKDVSTAERFYRWIAGVRMIDDQWMLGHGPSTFYTEYKPYAVPAFRTWVSDNNEHSTVHNYYLLVAIEQGIPGLIIFLLLLGAMLFYAQYVYHRSSDPFYKTVAMTTGVVIVMISTVNLLSDLIETDKIGSLFFLCFSLLLVSHGGSVTKEDVIKRPL